MIPVSTIEVLGRTYTIKENPEVADEGADGRINLRTREIEVAPGLSADDFRETVLHEACHVIEDRDDIKISHKALRAMSVHFDIFLAANPQFTALYGGGNGRTE